MNEKRNQKESYFNRKELEYYIKETGFTVEKHDETDLYIYGYHASGSGIREWNDLTIHCRGLILDNKGKVQARGFTKFFTFRKYISEDTILLSEGQVLKLPDCNYRVYDKLDGSLAILYWVNDIPYLASQRSFKSLKARKATQILHEKYPHTFNKLQKGRTYLFEAIYPEARVVVDYGKKEDLYLIGIIDNKTGQDLPLEDIGFPLTEELTEKFEYLENLQDIQGLDVANKEGVVVVYENGLRIKVKYIGFQRLSKLVSRVIDHERAYYRLLKQVKLFYGLPKNELTSEKVWDLFNNGYNSESIKVFIPTLFYHCGVQEWLNEEYELYMRALKKINKLADNNVIPSVNRIFDFNSEMMEAKSEMIMWNTLINLNKMFD